MALTKNIYPPIVPAYQPAFDMESKEGCKFYFSISTLNSLREIKHIQLTCNNLITNQNALYSSGISGGEEDRKTWKNRIRFYQLDEIHYDDQKGMYYLYITNDDLEGGFSNTSYKIQIRFGSIEFNYVSDDKASWITGNLDNFSEWSTICIIKAIPTPEFSVVGFSDIEDEETVLQTSAITCVGQYYCEDAAEVLQSYRFKIYNNTGELLEDSGLISCPVYAGSDNYVTFVDNKQIIQYDVKYFLEENQSYILEWYYVTKNYFEDSGKYNFTIIQNENFPLDVQLVISPDEENGRNKIHMISEGMVIGNLAIRRSSNKSNFTSWEDIKIIQVDGTSLELIEYDYTIESGVWYRYGIQRVSNRNERGPITLGVSGYYNYDHEKQNLVITNQKEVINNYYDCFLYGNGIQLKLEYNTKISSFQNTVLESKTDTIGSKYAFIRRNGNVYYKEFPINSLITGICDKNHLFATPEDIYGGELPVLLYNSYNDKQNISKYYDYNFEREFRNLVYDFLYDGNNKLFKSPTEGNILVRLMNITFSPEETLGRLIYNLSCNAYEQGNTSFATLQTLGIMNRGDFQIDNDVKKLVNAIGQIYGDIKNGENLVDRINEQYKKIEFGYSYKVGHITSIHIEAPPDTIIRVNNQEIKMGITGVYEYNDDVITDLAIYADSNDIFNDEVWLETDIIIDFEYQLVIQEDNSESFINAYHYKAIGELYQEFEADQDVVTLIKQRYYDKQKEFLIEVAKIESIRIEAYDVAFNLPNGTTVYKKVEFKINNIEPPFVMNDSCVYELQSGIIDINSLKFTTKTLAKIEYVCRNRKGIYQ